MAITTKLYRNRFRIMFLVAIFYAIAVVFFVQLAHLESNQPPGSMMPLPNIFDVDLHIPEENLPPFTRAVSSQILNENTMSQPLEYVDWNDYEFMAKDAQRQGWGEQGAAFSKILSLEEQKLSKQLWEQYKFNAFASDHISLERSIGDLRSDVCKTQKFLKNLPENSVSVVIIFHNEKNSTVLRSIHSVVNRSPAKLLREIVLVDDFSSNQELQEAFENYIRLHFTKVRLIRNNQRLGLILSRMVGANATKGEIIFFLDSHVEVNYNYLPPLLDPIVLDYRNIVCPVVDIVNDVTMKITQIERIERGAFGWDMAFRRLPVLHKVETEPYHVPVMVGSAFAISRKWWEEIGQYDPELKIWGGEQFEISFKSWQCGGSVVDAPCSRVAHVFKDLPYMNDVFRDKTVERNLLRVAKVWMDEYIEYVFQRRPDIRQMDPGDLTEQFAIKERLGCKSFKWYLQEVVPDLMKYFPLIDPPSKGWGKLRSQYNNSLCVIPKGGWLYLGDCIESQDIYYRYDWRQHITYTNSSYYCFTNRNKYIFTPKCIYYDANSTQSFVWDYTNMRIISLNTHLCMDFNVETMFVQMAKCNISKATQTWTFDNLNYTRVEEAWEEYRVQLEM